MPNRKTKRSVPKRSKKSGVKRRISKRPKLPKLSLLILECDTPFLNARWRTLGSDIDQLIRLLPTDTRVETAEINSEEDLRDRFAGYSDKYSSIDVVLVVGHANRDEIPLSQANHISYDWRRFARWFSHFNPRAIVLAACEAGQLPSNRAFFDEIPKLKSLFASPFKLERTQAEVIKFLIPYLVLAQKIDPSIISVGQVLFFLGTRAVILHCERRKGSQWNDYFQGLAALT